MRILVFDGARHRKPSGYGKASHALITGLAQRSDVEVTVQLTNAAWEIEEQFRAPIEKLPHSNKTNGFDAIIRVGFPGSPVKLASPTFLLCYVDLNGLPKDAEAHALTADGQLATSWNAFEYFSRLGAKVEHVVQGVDGAMYAPRPAYRREGSPKFSMLFVGTFSYRKGADLLLRAFMEEFTDAEAHLHLHVPESQSDTLLNMVIAEMRRVGRPCDVTVSTKALSEAWMARIYSRHDALISLSRGEGWGLPMCEAMLCGLPVIAPFSSAMRDYMREEHAYPVAADPVPCEAAAGAFGGAFGDRYGGQGLVYMEPRLEDAKRRMREVFNNRDTAMRKGAQAEAYIRSTFTPERFAETALAGVKKLLERMG